MNAKDDLPEKEVWEKFSNTLLGKPEKKVDEEIDANLLAEYLEGRCGESRALEMERALVRSPELRTRLCELSEVLSSGEEQIGKVPFMEDRVLRALREDMNRSGKKFRFSGFFSAVAAAVLLLTSVSAYQLGLQSKHANNQDDAIVYSQLVVESESFGFGGGGEK